MINRPSERIDLGLGVDVDVGIRDGDECRAEDFVERSVVWWPLIGQYDVVDLGVATICYGNDCSDCNMGVEYDMNKMCGNLSNKFAYIPRHAALRPVALALTLSLISVEDEIHNIIYR